MTFTGPVVDAHNDLLLLVDHHRGDDAYFARHLLPQLRAGGVALQVLPVWIEEQRQPEGALRRTLELIEQAHRAIAAAGDEVRLCLTGEDVDAALAAGAVGVLLALEGCSGIGADADMLETMHRLGVRMASFTHFGRNALADGSAEGIPGGRLSRAGERAIEVMERVGMLVDVSHLSLASMRHVLEIATKPVIASHSSADALVSHHRNLPDDDLRAIAATGGVIGVNFFPLFVEASGRATIDDVVAHIAHIAEVAGIDHVGIGPDFTKELAIELFGDRQPIFDGIELCAAVDGVEGPADLLKIAAALERRGFDDVAVRKVMGGNFLRVLRP
jgi:membrane dipeptidase